MLRTVVRSWAKRLTIGSFSTGAASSATSAGVPPIVKARFPAPVSITAPTSLSLHALWRAVIISTNVRCVNMFIASGRLMVILALPLYFS